VPQTKSIGQTGVTKNSDNIFIGAKLVLAAQMPSAAERAVPAWAAP